MKGIVDMTVFDRIKKLADGQGVSVSKVATDLGFSENLFYQWKKASPKSDRLEKVADYFGVSVDYLLGRDEKSLSEENNGAAVQVGGLFRSVAKKEDLDDKEQQELKEDLDWYMKERARLIKERNKRG